MWYNYFFSNQIYSPKFLFVSSHYSYYLRHYPAPFLVYVCLYVHVFLYVYFCVYIAPCVYFLFFICPLYMFFMYIFCVCLLYISFEYVLCVYFLVYICFYCVNRSIYMSLYVHWSVCMLCSVCISICISFRQYGSMYTLSQKCLFSVCMFSLYVYVSVCISLRVYVSICTSLYVYIFVYILMCVKNGQPSKKTKVLSCLERYSAWTEK